MNTKELSIIIVNYNTLELIKKCLESIVTYLSNVTYEIVVVDNNSKDNSQEWLNQYAYNNSNVKVICSESNLGFGKANNEGLKVASGKYVLFLNSDTYLIDSSIRAIIDWIENVESCFGAGCLLLNPDLSFGVSYGRFPELLTVLIEVSSNRYCKLRAVIPEKENVVNKIDFPCGAFFIVKRHLLDKVGHFDERFFLYFEETDLAKRAKKSGYDIYYYGFTKIVHIGGASQSRRSSFINRMNFTSWSKYINKHEGKIISYLVKKLLKSYFCVKILYANAFKKKTVSDFFKEELESLENGWVL